jgi:hypothetical protein
VLKLPQAAVRLAIKPTKRTLTNQAPVRLLDLGYATFDSGSTNQFFIESAGSGASIILTNRSVSLVFLPPRAPQKSTNLASSVVSPGIVQAKPDLLTRMKEWENDVMATQMACEETQPLPLSKIFMMKRDDFLLYSLKVAIKAGNGFGSTGVEFFQAPYTKGIIRIGETSNDNGFAAVQLASLDDTKAVGFLIRLTPPSSSNLFDYLDPILRSFRFTAETVEDREVVKALIRGAGIQQRKEMPADQ